MIKKVLSGFLAVVMVLGVLSVAVAAKTSEEADTHLQFNKDGKFTIMQISDIQDNIIMRAPTKKLLRAILDKYKADLIVLTGDNISSTSLTKGSAALSINQFMSIFEQYGIPVVMTFGNHDDERTLADKAFQLSVYERYDCFVGCAGEDLGDSNLCTYYVPIYSSTDKNEMIFNVWMVDSGTYNTENDKGGYAATTKAQIEWYKNASKKLEAENGRKIPSLMFQHIVVPEVFEALKEVPAGTEGAVERGGKYYTLPEGAKGVLGETPCPPNYNNGQFDAVVERGDVLAMFFGHDHVNTYELTYKNIGLICSPGIGFNSYNSEVVGARLITIDESNPQAFETQVVSYFDMFDYDDDVARLLFKSDSDTESTATNFAAFFKAIFAWFKSLFDFAK